MTSKKPTQKTENTSINLWIILRLLTSAAAAFASTIRGNTAIEKTVALWQIADFQLWLQRVFLVPWLRYDVVWYVHILTSGYMAGDGSTSFHPLYILLSAIPYHLGVSPLASLFTIGSLAGILFFGVFYKFARLNTEHQQSFLSLLFFASFPVSFIVFMPYTESLFLLFSTFALYTMHQRKWGMTAIATLLASLTRQQGVFLFFPIIWTIWEDSNHQNQSILKNWQGWSASFCAPLGLFSWTIYRVFILQEGSIETKSLQSFFYSALLSPYAQKIIPDQRLIFPWKAFSQGLKQIAENPTTSSVMNITLGIWFLILFMLGWKYMRSADRIYSSVVVLVSFSMSTGGNNVYLSLPRHLFLAVPVFISLTFAVKKSWQQLSLISLQFLLQLFMITLYVIRIWIP